MISQVNKENLKSFNISLLNKGEDTLEWKSKDSIINKSNFQSILSVNLQALLNKGENIKLEKFTKKFILDESVSEAVKNIKFSSSLFGPKTSKNQNIKQHSSVFSGKNGDILGHSSNVFKQESTSVKLDPKDDKHLTSAIKKRKRSDSQSTVEYLEKNLNNEFITSISFKEPSENLIRKAYFPSSYKFLKSYTESLV